MQEVEEKKVNQAEVTMLEENLISINGVKYRIVENYENGFNQESLALRYNTVLDKYDYIVGDWGYDQLRFKGFFDNDRAESTMDNRLAYLTDYLVEYCNFGCAYFVLEKVDKPKVKKKTSSNKKQHTAKNGNKPNVRKKNTSNKKNDSKKQNISKNNNSNSAKNNSTRKLKNNKPKKATNDVKNKQTAKSPKVAKKPSFKIRKVGNDK
ncbi:YutD family protein [Lactobacillus terrae]|uniref:YutD family protein n=1 Tax=Lactobacillus terrae TaxID=2269374 RepID=UPI001FE5CD34|nr:YutD family protein [Lactobacillus terrae]